jgi:hypothetical protein
MSSSSRSDDADAAQLVRMPAQHFQHVAIVRAVDADLHQHAPRHALAAQHVQVHPLGRGRGRVGALRHHGIGAGVVGHDVGMGVDGAEGDVERGRLVPAQRQWGEAAGNIRVGA